MKKVFQILVSIAILCICLAYLYLNREQLAILKNVVFVDIFYLITALFLFFALTGYTFNLLINLLGVKLSAMETVGLSILTNFGNYLGPTRPGAAIKAIYLKTEKNFPYSSFTSVLAANTLLVFFMTGSTGLVLLILLKLKKTPIPFLLVSASLGLVFISFAPFIRRVPNIKKIGRISNFVQSSIEGFNIIRIQKKKLLLICGTFIAQFFLSAVIFIIAFKSLGVSISLLSAMIIGVFTSISNFFTITPNNLGIQEAVIAYLFTVTGFDFSTGIICASLVRVVHMVITFTFTPIFAHYLLRSQRLKLGQIILRN